MTLTIIDKPSQNFNDRNGYNINKIILHYTDMKSADDVAQRFLDTETEVSAHYLIDTDGTIIQFVAEENRAWHAGIAIWQSEENINASSIGIELQNGGEQFGYDDFPDVQIDALITLIKDIKTRHTIVKQNILAHSDIAPSRKIDPDYKFPWDKLAKHDLCIVPEPVETDIPLLDLLDMIGYNTENATDAITAFQRRYRPSKIDGNIDDECSQLAMGIIVKMEEIKIKPRR
ncbi:MAG: N-acetylmuramoyl-L-alanine amidase [Alphaproteobacteria bacterium]